VAKRGEFKFSLRIISRTARGDYKRHVKMLALAACLSNRSLISEKELISRV